MPPETRQKLNLQKKLDRAKNRNENISKKLKQDASDVRKLRGKIEDMKNILDMLNKKLAEERRNERPDVTQMVKRLNILKKNEKVVKEKAKLIAMEEENATIQLEQLKQFTDDDNALRIEQNIIQLEAKVKALKEQFSMKKKTALKKKKYPLTVKADMDELENRRKEVNVQIYQQTRKEDELREDIDKVTKAMATKRLRVPKQPE